MRKTIEDVTENLSVPVFCLILFFIPHAALAIEAGLIILLLGNGIDNRGKA